MNNLLLRFNCSKCGERLTIVYDGKPTKEPNKDDLYDSQEDPRPGIMACEPPRLSIEPCWACINKYTAPAKQLMEAVQTLELNYKDLEKNENTVK